jgi:hypothetical protein
MKISLPTWKKTLNNNSFGPTAEDIKSWNLPLPTIGHIATKEDIDLDKFRRDSEELLQQQNKKRDFQGSLLSSKRIAEQWDKRVLGPNSELAQAQRKEAIDFQDAYRQFLTGQMSVDDFNKFRQNMGHQIGEYEYQNMKRKEVMDDRFDRGFAQERTTPSSGPNPKRALFS